MVLLGFVAIVPLIMLGQFVYTGFLDWIVTSYFAEGGHAVTPGGTDYDSDRECDGDDDYASVDRGTGLFLLAKQKRKSHRKWLW